MHAAISVIVGEDTGKTLAVKLVVDEQVSSSGPLFYRRNAERRLSYTMPISFYADRSAVIGRVKDNGSKFNPGAKYQFVLRCLVAPFNAAFATKDILATCTLICPVGFYERFQPKRQTFYPTCKGNVAQVRSLIGTDVFSACAIDV